MNIEVIAQNAIKITTKEEKNIYCDPFRLNGNTENDADMIFITHPHFDHFSPEDIKLIKNENTKIVITADLLQRTIECGFIEKNILIAIPNNEYDYDGIKFSTIPAYNTDKDFHKREKNWLGYIIEIDNEKVYIAGDTDITDEALKVECDIAFVPVGGKYTMNAVEAADLVEQINPRKYAIPTHYHTLVGTVEDAMKFKQLLENKVEVKILMKI